MRLAIAPAGQINDPMLLRVPAASLKTLGQYGAQLAKRGVEPKYVVTKIGFDYSVSHPALTFKASRFVDEAELSEIEATLRDEAETIGQIIGTSVAPNVEAIADAEPPAHVVKSAKLKEAEMEAVAAPKASVKVEDEEEAPKPKAKKAAVVESDDVLAALDNLDFDD